MKKKSIVLLSALALSVALAGCTGGEPPAAAPEEPVAVSVEVSQVTQGSINDEAGIIANLAANETVQVSPKVSGKIQSINLKIGQQVKQGDVLFTLDPKDTQDSIRQSEESYQVALANLKQAESGYQQSVQQAKSAVDQAKSGLTQQKSAIGQAQNGVADAESALRDAQNAAQRTQQLHAAGAVSQSELEQAQTGLRQAQSALNNAQIALSNAQTSLESAQTSYDNAQKSYQLAQQRAGIEVARASANQSKAALDTARSQLADLTVKTPISGSIAAVNGTTGQMVGQSAVVTIANTNPIVAKANLSESDIQKLSLGSPVTVGVAALNERIEAKVTAISSVMDNDLRAYPAEISIPNNGGALKAGMIANIYFKSEGEQGLLVPQSAIVEQSGQKYVFIIEGTVAKRVEIKPAAESSTQVQVSEGLTAGQQIVTKGSSMLTDGATVNIVNSNQ